MENYEDIAGASENPQAKVWNRVTQEQVKTPEQIREEERMRGKKVLGAVNFHESHKLQVEKAFNEARNNGIKFGSGESPRDRRIGAYLASFENESDQTTVEKEKEFFNSQTKEILADVPEFVEQNLRDQLEDWSDYLGSEEAEYPTWFKLWAWDGMTRLGGYNTKTGNFDKRSKETIHTYPPLDKESLRDVYQLLKNYHDNPENFNEDGLDIKNIKNYNFNMIYSHFMNKHIVPTPEYGEQIRGSWIEYEDGQEEEVAKAANGTGWCIVSPTKAKEYLEKGSFLLLHLENPHNGDELDSHACASIRLENGKVAEISGRRPGSGQMLEDALVETVGRKVLTMPGGEEYREAFRDRMELIRLCHKEEDLSREELEFVYGIGHEIPKLEKHCSLEPHLAELRTKYDLERAISLGVDKDAIVKSVLSGSHNDSINENNTLRNLDSLLRLGISSEQILKALSPKSVVDNFARLTEGGVSPDDAMERMGEDFVAGNIKTLLNAGVSIESIMLNMKEYGIQGHLEELLDNGVGVQLIVDRLWPEDILKNLDLLNQHGANINPEAVIAEMGPMEVLRSSDSINALGIDYNIYEAAVSQITVEQALDANAQNEIFNFVKNPTTDIESFIQSINQDVLAALPLIKIAIIARLKQDQKDARKSQDAQKASAISAQLRELGYLEDDDDDFYS